MANLDEIQIENPAQTMRDVFEKLGKTEEIDLPAPDEHQFSSPTVLTVPQGREMRDVTGIIRDAAQYLKPARRKGTAQLADLNSLIGWAKRFKGDTSVLFADPDMSAPSLTCIADYHAAGSIDVDTNTGDPSARHCHHKGVYSFPLSDEWKEWMNISGEPLGKDELGEFIEANAKDIMDPTPAILNGAENSKNQDWENRLIRTAQQIQGRYGQLTGLLAMSRKFQVFETSDLKVETNRDTGEADLKFLSEHKDANGEKLNIPNLIIIAIPVFRGGALYRMPVRFRYRKKGPNISFILSIYNPEKSFEASFTEAIHRTRDETELPLFLGSPET